MDRAPDAPDHDVEETAQAPAPRSEPMMEAPDLAAATSAGAAGSNPGQGDRSFGFGSAREPSAPQADAAAGQGDMTEDAP